MKPIATFAAVVLGVVFSTQFASAEPVSVGDLQLTGLWARATPPSAPAGGGFLTIENTGDTPDRLVAVTADHAGLAEIHEMSVDDGVMVMRPLADGLVIPPHETVVLEPGGYHLMFMNLKEGQKAGQKLPVTLTFENAGSVDIVLDIAPVGAPGPAKNGMDGGDPMEMDHGDGMDAAGDSGGK